MRHTIKQKLLLALMLILISTIAFAVTSGDTYGIAILAYLTSCFISLYSIVYLLFLLYFKKASKTYHIITSVLYIGYFIFIIRAYVAFNMSFVEFLKSPVGLVKASVVFMIFCSVLNIYFITALSEKREQNMD